MEHSFFTGTSGLMLPVPNKTRYPEAFQNSSRLHYYASLANSIEINSSFYHMPRATTVEKWAGDTGPQFQFSFKLNKAFTHHAGNVIDKKLLSSFFESLAPLGTKAGIILMQLPPKADISRFGHLRKLIRQICDLSGYGGFRIALECRSESMYVAEVADFLEEMNIAMVIHDHRNAPTPLHRDTANFCYFRFHGPGGNYRQSYADDEIGEYAGLIHEKLLEGKQVYCYFNNTMGTAFADMQKLRKSVERLDGKQIII